MPHRSLILCFFLILLALFALLIPRAVIAAPSIKIFAAASLSAAMEEAVRVFEKKTGHRVVPVFASSSNLAKQILNGAPADVIISANQSWMDRLERENRVEPGSRVTFLGNYLSLVAPAKSDAGFIWGTKTRLSELLQGGRLAMGDPDHVPVGLYGKAALQSLGLWDDISPHLAPAPNARAALAYIERGETPLGIVYSSDLIGRKKLREVARFPKSAYPPIIYPLAVIKARSSSAVKAFVTFLQSNAAQAIFSRHGFLPSGATN